MPAPDLHTVHGLILAVQEERFRLLTSSGQGYLLRLATSAGASMRDLRAWHAQNVPVIVQYEGQPNLETGIAHSVRPR